MEMVELSGVSAVPSPRLAYAPSSGLVTIAMYTFRLVSWLIPLHSYTFFLKLLTAELAVGFTVIDVYVRQWSLVWGGCFPGRGDKQAVALSRSHNVAPTACHTAS